MELIVLEKDQWGDMVGHYATPDTVNGRTVVGAIPEDKGTCSYRKDAPATHTAVNRSPEGVWGLQHVCRDCGEEIQEGMTGEEFHMPVDWWEH